MPAINQPFDPNAYGQTAFQADPNFLQKMQELFGGAMQQRTAARGQTQSNTDELIRQLTALNDQSQTAGQPTREDRIADAMGSLSQNYIAALPMMYATPGGVATRMLPDTSALVGNMRAQRAEELAQRAQERQAALQRLQTQGQLAHLKTTSMNEGLNAGAADAMDSAKFQSGLLEHGEGQRRQSWQDALTLAGYNRQGEVSNQQIGLQRSQLGEESRHNRAAEDLQRKQFEQQLAIAQRDAIRYNFDKMEDANGKVANEEAVKAFERTKNLYESSKPLFGSTTPQDQARLIELAARSIEPDARFVEGKGLVASPETLDVMNRLGLNVQKFLSGHPLTPDQQRIIERQMFQTQESYRDLAGSAMAPYASAARQRGLDLNLFNHRGVMTPGERFRFPDGFAGGASVNIPGAGSLAMPGQQPPGPVHLDPRAIEQLKRMYPDKYGNLPNTPNPAMSAEDRQRWFNRQWGAQ